MAEQSPHEVVNKDKSVGESSSTGPHASHLSQPDALDGASHIHQAQPSSTHPSPLDSKLSHHPPTLNGTIDRDLDNPTPDHLGSDTDSSRPDASTLARSASVKKPVSFKPVSITKSFLAKTATPGSTPPPTKVPEKGAPL